MFYLSIVLLITLGSGYFLNKKRLHELGYHVIDILERYHGHMTDTELHERLRKKGVKSTLRMVRKTCLELQKAGCVIQHEDTDIYSFRIGGGAWIKWNHREPFRTSRLPT